MFSCIAGRRRLWSVLGATILILFILSCSDDDTVKKIPNTENHSAWMSDLDDGTLAYKVSLPSSHDTASWEDNLNARGSATNIHTEKVLAVTQNADILTQWAAGARGFDLRVYWETNERNGVKGSIRVAHGHGDFWFESKESFEDLFKDIVDLLVEHPTEYVFIRVAIERDISSDNCETYRDKVHAFMDTYYNIQHSKKKYKDYIYGTPDINTTVGELRGKIVLLPAKIAGKGELKDGGEDPFLKYGPALNEFYTYNLVDDHDPDHLIENFINIDGEKKGPGFGFGESNHPGTAIWSPEHFAPEIQIKLISYLYGEIVDNVYMGGDQLKHIGVLNIDFISAGDGETKDNGEWLAHTVISVNFRE